MRFLRTLGEGDRFRPAHPNQVSLNNRKMDGTRTYVIAKVYSQSPYLVISRDELSPAGGIYSLGPSTPVLLPKEFDPTPEEVIQFIAPRGTKKVVGYRLLWDGKTNLRNIVGPQPAAIIKVLFAVGKSEYGATELVQILTEHYEKFRPKGTTLEGFRALYIYRRLLVERGLLEEVVDVAPATEAIRESNLQGEMR